MFARFFMFLTCMHLLYDLLLLLSLLFIQNIFISDRLLRIVAWFGIASNFIYKLSGINNLHTTTHHVDDVMSSQNVCYFTVVGVSLLLQRTS